MSGERADEAVVAYEQFKPDEEGQREALCTLGNGYIAARGAAPESRAGDVHYPGTYAAGCYNRLRDVMDGHTIENESIVNLPNWLPLTFRIGDGPWFQLEAVDILEYRQDLDMRRGVLTRTVRFRDTADRTTRLTQRRFVHMEYEHLCGLQTTIVAEDWSGRIDVRSALDGTVENSGVERYRKLSGRHLHPLLAEAADEETLLLIAETTQSHIRIAEAARTRVFVGDRPVHGERGLAVEPGWIAHDLGIDIGRGEPVTIDKLVAVYTSRDRAISEPGMAATNLLAMTGSFDELLERHVRAWARLWERSSFEMEDNEDTLRIIRLHVFHTLQTVSLNSVDLDVGVPPRGLHGEAYRGHVLWDELFVFPILNLRFPLVTRTLLRYRYRRLAAARWAAREAGYSGAMYPWQSGSDGRRRTRRSTSTRSRAGGCPTPRTGSVTWASLSPTTSGSTTRPPATTSSSSITARR